MRVAVLVAPRRIIGDRASLDEPLQRLIADVERKTAGNTGLQLLVAFNYGGKAEITAATKQIARAVKAGLIDPEDITERTIQAALYTAGLPDPDLIIRTSGEQRISNFLLWQCAYAEFLFVDNFWPDFTRQTLESAIASYQQRERRFGGLAG